MTMDSTDQDMIMALAGCSLAKTPGKDNWVDHAGGLPNYICRIAKHIKESGKSTSTAIAMAISTVKRWAAGGDGVEPDTQAKAAKAVAEWEALKAKAKSKRAAKTLAASADSYGILALGATFADPGFLEDQAPRYSLQDQERVLWGLNHLTQNKSTLGYTDEQFQQVRSILESAVDDCGCGSEKVTKAEPDDGDMEVSAELDAELQDLLAE